MYKKLLLLPIFSSFLLAQTVKPKVMHAQDTKNYEHNYNNSQNTTEDKVISSTAEASAEITVVITLQVSTEMISQTNRSAATLSYLDNNRIQITEELAQGEGEYLETLLSMMELKNNRENLEKLQNNFDDLIYLSHNDFLNKVKSLV